MEHNNHKDQLAIDHEDDDDDGDDGHDGDVEVLVRPLNKSFLAPQLVLQLHHISGDTLQELDKPEQVVVGPFSLGEISLEKVERSSKKKRAKSGRDL